MDKFDELKKYKELLDEGIISQAEFDKKKSEVLASSDSNKPVTSETSFLQKENTASNDKNARDNTLEMMEKLNGKTQKSQRSSATTNRPSDVSKMLPKKIIAIAAAVIVVCLIIFAMPNGTSKAERELKSCLLNPSSLIIYEVYVNDDYDGSQATLFYFGAENKGGGITDDWAFVQDGEVQFYSTYEDAKAEGDTQGILSCGDVIVAKTAVITGSPAWEEVNP